MQILIAFLIIAIIGLVVIISKQYKTVTLQQKYIIKMYNRWVDIHNTMKRLDNRQMFEEDDQVGVLFEKIKKLIMQYTVQLVSEIDISK